MKVTAVIPAYNEENRVGAVIDVVKRCSLVDQIIVVSDGSTDRTAEIASSYDGVMSLKLVRNLGKGGALLEGVKNADFEVIVFLDADLIGLHPEHVEALITPVLDGSVGMSIGVFKGGRKCTDWAQVITPYISGQRALLKDDFLSIPNLQNARYGVEVAMGQYARENEIAIRMVTFPGVTHPMKEEKLGVFRGSFARSKMYFEIFKLVLNTSPRTIKLKRRLGITAEDRSSRS
ncbi:MAG: glycosyltransferase family 2 protein [Armatimonadota bacterium]